MPRHDPAREKAPRPGAFFRFGRSATLALALLLPLAVAARSETATVRHVVDGDTVILGDERHVRLIGVNAPELGHDGQPDEPFAAAARDRLRALVEHQSVRLEFEEESRDHYGRWLAHLRLADGRSVEMVLIKEGLASVVAIPPNVREVARLEADEAEARRAHRGLWADAYSRPLPAESLTTETGYRFVRGRVLHVGRSRKFVYLDLGPRLAVRIEHDNWRRYFHGRPEDWRGRELIARGWISENQGRLHLGVGHPAMIEALDGTSVSQRPRFIPESKR